MSGERAEPLAALGVRSSYAQFQVRHLHRIFVFNFLPRYHHEDADPVVSRPVTDPRDVGSSLAPYKEHVHVGLCKQVSDVMGS